MKARKVGAGDNLADALTKGVDACAIAKKVEGVDIELREDRHAIAPKLDKDASVEVRPDFELKSFNSEV